MRDVILDVREKDEFGAERIEGSIHVPLSDFTSVAPGVLSQLSERNLVIMCRSGGRAKLAAQQIGQLGYSDKVNASVYEGGLLEWKRQDKPTVVRKRGHLPVLRQVHLIAGSTVLVTSLLGAFVDPRFLAVTAFFGAGLSFSGATGFCGMASFLGLMPWNRAGRK